MSKQIYFLTLNSSETKFIGSGYSPDGTLPTKAIACTQEQAQNFQAWSPDMSTIPPSVVSASAAQLLEQSRNSQAAALRHSYQEAISACPVTVNGTAYDLSLSQANISTNLSAYMSAQTALASPAWTADADATLGQLCTVSGIPLFCSTAGTTGSTAPTVPTEIGKSVTDGTAEWELFARSAELTNGSFAWFTAAEIVSVGQQIELFLHTQKSTLIGLLDEVAAQTAVPSTPVTWP